MSPSHGGNTHPPTEPPGGGYFLGPIPSLGTEWYLGMIRLSFPRSQDDPIFGTQNKVKRGLRPGEFRSFSRPSCRKIVVEDNQLSGIGRRPLEGAAAASIETDTQGVGAQELEGTAPRIYGAAAQATVPKDTSPLLDKK